MSIKYLDTAENSQETTWINAETGERIKARVVEKRLKREDFEVTYVAMMTRALEILGTKKILVLKYLLTERDYNNRVVATLRKISNDLNVSITVVYDTLCILRDEGIISMEQRGVYMLNPRIVNKGSAEHEKALLFKFKMIQSKSDNNSVTSSSVAAAAASESNEQVIFN